MRTMSFFFDSAVARKAMALIKRNLLLHLLCIFFYRHDDDKRHAFYSVMPAYLSPPSFCVKAGGKHFIPPPPPQATFFPIQCTKKKNIKEREDSPVTFCSGSKERTTFPKVFFRLFSSFLHLFCAGWGWGRGAPPGSPSSSPPSTSRSERYLFQDAHRRRSGNTVSPPPPYV